MIKAMFVLGTALVGSVVGGGPARAAELTLTGCTTTYEAAMVSNLLANGPVHVGGAGGTVSVGGFTPSVFLDGAVTPTVTYVGCV